MASQLSLPLARGPWAAGPEGLRYLPGFLGPREERELATRVESLEWKEVRMHGVVGRRRVAHFGLDYTYDSRKVTPTDPPPAWLEPLLRRGARVMGARPSEIAEVLFSKYPPGAGIGWHRDAPMFGDAVFGVSLGGACTMRFRRGRPGAWETFRLDLEPGSAYLLSGPARWSWQHSIPAVQELRYSITLRTLRS